MLEHYHFLHITFYHVVPNLHLPTAFLLFGFVSGIFVSGLYLVSGFFYLALFLVFVYLALLLGFVSGTAQKFFPCVMDSHFFDQNICTWLVILYFSWMFIIFCPTFFISIKTNCLYWKARFYMKLLSINCITKSLLKPENLVQKCTFVDNKVRTLWDLFVNLFTISSYIFVIFMINGFILIVVFI